jgi:hypothetical protein
MPSSTPTTYDRQWDWCWAPQAGALSGPDGNAWLVREVTTRRPAEADTAFQIHDS